MKKYQPHPAALAMPPMSPEDMDALKKSIVERGQVHPAVLFNGKLLDGRNRQEAIDQLNRERKLNLELKVVEWNGRGDSPAAFVDATNDKRRHLTDSQRGMVAAKLLPFFRLEAKERQKKNAKASTGKRKQPELKGVVPKKKGERASKLAAKAAGGKVSSRSVERAEFVSQNDKALAQKVFEGELTLKQAEKQIRLKGQHKAIAAYVPPEGKFQLVTTDFSWEYEDAREGNDNQRGLPYPPMTVNEILAFVRGPLARCCDAVCLLGCWVTNPILLDLMTWAVVQVEIQKLGFRAVKLNTWHKVEKSGKPFIGQGTGQRNDTEQLILFARGAVVYNEMGAAHGNPLQSTWFEAPVGEHSQKPDLAYERLEKLVPYTVRLEMFARAPRKGWVTSGAEMPEAVPASEPATIGAGNPLSAQVPPVGSEALRPVADPVTGMVKGARMSYAEAWAARQKQVEAEVAEEPSPESITAPDAGEIPF